MLVEMNTLITKNIHPIFKIEYSIGCLYREALLHLEQGHNNEGARLLKSVVSTADSMEITLWDDKFLKKAKTKLKRKFGIVVNYSDSGVEFLTRSENDIDIDIDSDSDSDSDWPL